MSVNISFANGVAEFFVAGAPAWHNLGVNVKNAKRWEDAVALAHLDWTVSKQQLQNPVVPGAMIPYYGLLRDDTHDVLHVVGNGYFPIQNTQCFDFVDALLEAREAHYEAAGALDGGRVVWCLARLNKSFSVVKSDEHKTYLLFVDYRDGRSAQIKVVDERVVCANTLAIALREQGTALKLRHVKSVTEKIKLAKTLVAGVSAQINSLEDKLKRLAKKKVTEEKFAAVLTKLFPHIDTSARQQNQAAIIATNFMSNDQNAIPEIKGSAYNLFNACTQYVDHQKDGFRGEAVGMRRAEYALFEKEGVEWKTDALNNICSIMGIDGEPEPVEITAVNRILSQVAI
jgi:phage/plasmid-like protein (TIGR03299 family)